MAESNEVSIVSNSGNCENKTVKKSPLTFKNLYKAMSYLISDIRQVSIKLK